MIQIAVLLMVSTTCYSFAGCLYRQRKGLGIGLRASACLARVCMCKWDQLWSSIHQTLGLKIILFFRYIDDLRLMLFPIKPGYRWNINKWENSMDDNDCRSPEVRTREELGKSMDSIWKFVSFTTEGTEDYCDMKLPTLDFNAWIEDDWTINYINYTKPMANNVVLHKDTALSRNCVFSSLRQDLVRRLLTTRLECNLEARLEVVNKFIQLLVNSNHSFTYIKAIVLQGLTKFSWMVSRNNLSKNNKMYKPIHRLRGYKSEERKLSKYLNFGTWYNELKTGDKYDKIWKKNITRKGENWKNKKKRNFQVLKHEVETQKNKPTTSVMFVPASLNGELTQKIQNSEELIQVETSWKCKVVEKPGMPLLNMFQKKFPMKDGCPLGMECSLCENTGLGCSSKGAVYRGWCNLCSKDEPSGTVTKSPEVLQKSDAMC